MPWFDFVIADKYALPQELTQYFTEKPLYIEGSFIPLTRDETPIREASRSEFGLDEEAFVMAAFGNVYKITPEMFSTWMELLNEIPRAVLWIIDDNPTTTANLKAHAVAANADLKRIQFTPRTTHIEYKSKLRLADVFLDTFPYNCGSTTNDVVQAGVPIVTMSGRTLVSRMGGSILDSLGLSQLVTSNHDDYKEKIITLSDTQNTTLQNLKIKLSNSRTTGTGKHVAQSIIKKISTF
jgi:predicted O-linked N-acetylglucosamine transferase (SPINDLY family)